MATIKPTSVPAKRLSETISGSASSFKVNNIKSWQYTSGAYTDLTSADFGTRLWAVFRNSAGTLMEIMEIDPATITAASSPITILYRGLKFDGTDQTEVSANKLTWVKGDTIVEIGTHVPQLLAQYVDKVQDQTIAGVKTFSSFPQKSGTTTPTVAAELATKAYVDLIGTGSAVYDQEMFVGTAGETLVATDLCYYKTSDQRWWKADADAIATCLGMKLAVAQGGATAGNTLNMLGGGLNKNFTGLTAGAAYFVSNTTGGISTTPGTYARFIGRAVSTTNLHFDPDNGYTIGKYGSEIYAADSVGTDAYAVTTSPAFASLKDGMVVRFKAGTVNTGAATLAVDGLTAKAIRKNYDDVLSDGDIAAGQIVEVVYDSANDWFQMLSQVGVASTPLFPQFGDGNDGDVTISAGTTTLARDMYYNNLTIETGGVLNPTGYRIFVKGTLTFQGTGIIARNGNAGGNGGTGTNGSAGTGGAGGSAGTAGGALAAGNIAGGAAGTAGAGGGAGTDGGASPGGAGGNASAAANQTSAVGTAGVAGTGASGAGGSGFNGVSGGAAANGVVAGGTVTNPLMMPRTVENAVSLHYFSNTTFAFMNGSAGTAGGSGGGGGAGGNQGAGTAGGGGGGGGGGAGGCGGMVMVAAYAVVGGTTTCVQALGGAAGNGGNGGNGSASHAGSGGGGGGGNGGTGGVVVFVYHSYSGTALTTACVAGGAFGTGGTPGTPGTGGGTGGSGSSGATGATGKLYSFAV